MQKIIKLFGTLKAKITHNYTTFTKFTNIYLLSLFEFVIIWKNATTNKYDYDVIV